MIVRTPLPKKRKPETTGNSESPNSDGHLVIFEDLPVPEPSHQHSDQMMCTYQCRQMVKADFLDALSSAEKQSQNYHSKLEAMNDDLLKSEAERMKFRDQILYAEQELAAARGREEALQDQLLEEINESQERLRKQIHIHSELEVKFRKEMDLRKKAESLLSSAEEKASLLEGKLSHVSESTEREKVRLQKDLTQLKQESKLSISRISADLEKMECKAINFEKEATLLKEQLESLQSQLNECLHEKNEVEKKLSTLTYQEAPSSDDSILVKHLREELRNYESEVREARKWKSSHEDIELLREKLLEEKSRRERAELGISELSEAQLNAKKLQDELSCWESMMKEIPGVTCAADIPPKFAALQKDVIESMMKMGEVSARLKQVEVAFDAAENGRQTAETESALTKEKVELLKLDLKRNELLLSSVTEERDRLKTAVDQLKQQKNAETGAASAMTDGTLESSLAIKEDYIKKLESSVLEQKDANARQHNEIKLLNERLNNELRRIKSLEREDDRLRSEIAILESKVGHGDFSSASTKVLRMVNSLAVDSEAKQTIEALQNELQKTKEKLQAVEELKKQSADAGTLVDSYISGKTVQLKEQIATLEKREERYKTVFADRISVFRRACCELFGYKIVMDDHQRSDGIPVTRFTLHSIYAQSEDEKLQFEYESGNTKILGNNYTQQRDISKQVEIFIGKMNSIPAFTANLTIESFNKRTLS
ncbi:mitotic spindle checkpoint protein MAD1 [Lactuca sativa]|uniref:Spindle assembly checkpoint component MAD1 n=1 Tax=Lactuca sativa TaxID=4236 RepID=A0A9R1X9K3_LACSA|nr:mitotic spindle checkpoint protein MAD1 [Lactuca sativa]KAJ0205990.1 hypothetical protein LSAT_V11C500265970 [Lactuca sativa]